MKRRYSKYNSPTIESVSNLIDKLRKDKRYSGDNISTALKMEFTDRYNRMMKTIRAEENRIAFLNGDWKSKREFTDELSEDDNEQ